MRTRQHPSALLFGFGCLLCAVSQADDELQTTRYPASKGCAVDAAVLFVTRHTERHTTFEAMRRVVDEDGDGNSTFADVLRGLSVHGGLKAELVKSRGRAPDSPAIMHFRKDLWGNPTSHFVYGEPSRDGTVLYYVPYGVVRVSGDTLWQMWDGYAIVPGRRHVDLAKVTIGSLLLGVGIWIGARAYAAIQRRGGAV